MPESQVDRLKRELRFLRESFEAGIISEEEYTKGKTRIESKLNEWGEGVVEEYGKRSETAEKKVEPKDIVVEEIPDEDPEEVEEEEEDDEEKYKKEVLENEVKERVQQEDEREGLKSQIEGLQMQIQEKNDDIKEREKEIRARDREKVKLNKKIEKLEKEVKKGNDKVKKLKQNGKKKSKNHFDVWKYVSLILVLVILLLFFTKIKPDIPEPTDPLLNETIAEEKVPVDVELMILNDFNCTACNTEKTIEVSKQLFPGLSVVSIDYNTEEGNVLYSYYNITYLPAYIFGEELNETESWISNERLRASFRNVNGKYLLKEESTGSNYEPEN